MIPAHFSKKYSSDKEGVLCIAFDFQFFDLSNYLDENFHQKYIERSEMKKQIKRLVDTKQLVKDAFEFSEILINPDEKIDTTMSIMALDKLMLLDQISKEKNEEKKTKKIDLSPYIPSLNQISLTLVNPLIEYKNDKIKFHSYKNVFSAPSQFSSGSSSSDVVSSLHNSGSVSEVPPLSPDLYKWSNNIKLHSPDSHSLQLVLPFNFCLLDLVNFLNSEESKRKIINFQLYLSIEAKLITISHNYNLKKLEMTKFWKKLSLNQRYLCILNLDYQLSLITRNLQFRDYLSNVEKLVLCASGYKVDSHSIFVPFFFNSEKLEECYENYKKKK